MSKQLYIVKEGLLKDMVVDLVRVTNAGTHVVRLRSDLGEGKVWKKGDIAHLSTGSLRKLVLP